MDDSRIIDLYFARNEQAIKETADKYGTLCLTLARNILTDRQDAEECVNDTYLALWHSIPPARPQNLKAFVCRIVRNKSLNRYDYNTASKRVCGAVISLSELAETVPDTSLPDAMDEAAIARKLSDFLRSETPAARRVFLRKYWFLDSIEAIAERYGYTEGKVKSMLYRTRERLKHYLQKG